MGIVWCIAGGIMLIGCGHCEERAHLPPLRSVTRNLFPFVQGSESVNSVSVSLFCSMHPNELNTILKYSRELMRKNECNAHLSFCSSACPRFFLPPQTSCCCKTANILVQKAQTHLQYDALTVRTHTHGRWAHSHTHRAKQMHLICLSERSSVERKLPRPTYWRM